MGERRPLYGGTQGIPTSVKVNEFLPAYAYADFKHDFGGDKITPNVLNDIETVGSRKTFFAKLQPLVGKSAYESFKPFFGQSIPGPVPKEEYTEEKLLNDIAKIPYDVHVGKEGSTVYEVAENVAIPIAGQLPRNYTIGRVTEKVKPGAPYVAELKTPPPVAGVYANLLSCLWAVSGKPGQRRKKFAIMYDAGNCATSEIGQLANAAITDLVKDPVKLFGEAFDPKATYEVFFVTSSENLRDPAPKIVDRTFKKTGVPANVHVYFLNDYGHRGSYTMYSKRAQSDQAANLYSRYTMTTIRDNDAERIRGTIEYEDGTKRQLDDLKRESEIESATTNAVSLFLQNASSEKSMSCFFLKRSGDWCQALCLLDKERKYTITGYGPRVGKTVTLQSLEDEGVEVMLMTHDRVLLAYGLTLGLNVCFTNNRPTGHWIVYFKNADVFRVDDASELGATAMALVKQLDIHREITAAVRSTYTSDLASIQWTKDHSINILDARQYAYVLANLVKDDVFVAQKAAIQALGAELSSYQKVFEDFAKGLKLEQLKSNPVALATAKKASDTLGKLRALLPNVQATIDLSVSVIGNLADVSKVAVSTEGRMTRSRAKLPTQSVSPSPTTLSPEMVFEFLKGKKYPEEQTERTTIANYELTLAESRPFKSSQKNKAGQEYNLEAEFTLIAERLYDDVQSAGVALPPFPNDVEIAAMATKRTQVSIIRSVFDILKKAGIRTRTGGQRGGDMDAYYLPQAIYAITQTAIPLVSTPDADTFGFTRGQHMTHYDRWKYFVVDPYLVTKEDQGVLVGALATANRASPEEKAQLNTLPYIQYLAFRLLVLYIDLAYNEWLLLSPANNPIDERPDPNEYVTPDEIALQLLRQRVDKLIAIVQKLAAKQDIVPLLLEYESFVPEIQTTPIAVSPLVDIQKLYGAIPGMMQAFKAFQYGDDLYAIETKPLPEGPSKFVMLIDPRTLAEQPYEIKPEDKFTGPRLQIPSKPGGAEYFQNILTNVYVPLIPQPNIAAQQSAIAQFRSQGGLRSEGEETTNVRADHDNVPPRKHARLRKRARTSTTSRVRQRSKGSKTRRQRKHVDRL